MNTVVVIPARFASTRLPGKPLRLIAGLPMVVRTARQAVQGGFPVWVAHDDARIAAALAGEPVQVVATRSDHANGTERLCEVADKEGWADDTIVVNVQGDEPLLPLDCIETVIATLQQNPRAAVATLATPLAAPAAADPNLVKVVCNQHGEALYFSRAPIPFDRDGLGASYLRHLGVYAYRAGVLRRYPTLSVSPLEHYEKLEQLRFLHHSETVAVAVIATAPPVGVDTEADLLRVEALLANQ